jgi:hypothetical protein
VSDPLGFHERALAAGGRELSPLGLRDWGAEVALVRSDGLPLPV